MTAKDTLKSGKALERKVKDLAESLGLNVRTQVELGTRVWGARRRVDLILNHPVTRQLLGIECKAQVSKGTAQEKIPATIQDIGVWPIRGLVVFEGKGFDDGMRSFLYSTGKAVEFEDLRDWLLLYFGILEEDLPKRAPRGPTVR